MSSYIEREIKHEFAEARLDDIRLDRRCHYRLVDLDKYCGKTLASDFRARSGNKDAYRLFANAKLDKRTVLTPHQDVKRYRKCKTFLELSPRDRMDTLRQSGSISSIRQHQLPR